MSISEGYYHYPHVAAQVYPNYETAVRDGLGYLGDEESFKRAFSTLPGGSAIYGDIVSMIQTQTSAQFAKFEASAKPFMIAAALFGFGGFLLGLSTFLRKG